MMTCHEAAQLISEQKDHKLGFKDRLGLRMHLVMCRMCNAYKNKLDMISRFARQASEFMLGEQPSAVTLSADAKDRIKRNLTSSD
jgi:hypothetical protein